MAGNHESSDTPNDPRGCGFRSRTTVEAMLALIDSTTRPVDAELISGNSALGRVLAESVISQVNIPSFDRAAMDGFALKAEETFGADLYTPAQFTLIGRSRPGTGYNGQVSAGQAVAIATGAPHPTGCQLRCAGRIYRSKRHTSFCQIFRNTWPSRWEDWGGCLERFTSHGSGPGLAPPGDWAACWSGYSENQSAEKARNCSHCYRRRDSIG